MRLRIPAAVVTAVMTLALSALPAHAAPEDDFPDPVGTVDPVDPALYDRVADGSEVRVNVVTASQADLASTAEAGETLHTFTEVPVRTLRVDAAGLDTLSGTLGVLSVTEDVPVPVSLNETTTVIGADKTAQAGNDGAGSTIAILDTGVAQNHPFLGGRITDQACFSTTDPAYGSTSLCPDGTDEQSGPGSADSESGPCATMGTACSHGTHVAGIAAGNGKDLTGAPRTGVAPGADIIAIQVFSRFTSANYCGAQPSCVMSFPSDQLLGLEKVYALKQAGRPIIAANMSLGNGRFTTTCDNDNRKAIIDALYDVGVATVVAAGNNAFTNAVNSPACVPSAVTVGATTDADQLASYTNRGPLVDVFAPGHAVVSSVPGNAYGTKNGTSMATPHVAGALAVLREAAPNAPLGDLIAALSGTGKPIAYTEDTTPRIQLDQAFERIRADQLPPPATKPRPTVLMDTKDFDIPGRGHGSVTSQMTSTLPGNAPTQLGVWYSVDGVGINNLTVDLIDPNGKAYRIETSATPRSFAATADADEELSAPMVSGPVDTYETVDVSGAPAAGTWKLRMENGYGDWVGTVLAWSLIFPNASGPSGATAIPDMAAVTSQAQVTGLGGNASGASQLSVVLNHARTADLKLTLVGPTGKSYPVPGSYYGGGWAETYPLDLGDSPADGTWTLKVEDTVAGTTGTLTGWSLTFLSFDHVTPQAIPDNGTVESVIPVENWIHEGSTPSSVRVYVDITHAKHGDLKLDLVGRDGTVYPLKAAGAQPGGTLRQIFTTDVTYTELGGDWKLRMQDTAPGATGTLNNWSLGF